MGTALGVGATQALERDLTFDRPIDLRAMLGPMRRGVGDPTMVWEGEHRVWRTAATPQGAVTQRVDVAGNRAVSRCWGEGSPWQTERFPLLLGHTDPGCARTDELLDAAVACPPGMPQPSVRLRGWRTPKSCNVWESVLAAVLEQKVTGKEARRSWRALVLDHGTPAPGPAPAGLRLAPEAGRVRRIPTWWWRRAGVDRKRSDTIMRLTRVGHVLDRLPRESHVESRRLLTALPGVGPWTAAEVAQRALGDPDAVSVGDYHLAGQIVYALTGQYGGTDDQMLELLAPFRGQRYRAVRAIELCGRSRPRRGPRMSVPAHIYG